MSIIFDNEKSASPGAQKSGGKDRNVDAGPVTPSPSASVPKDGVDADPVRIGRAVGIVGGATLLSRVLGAVRDMVIASFLGAGLVSDAFVAAFRVPNLLRRLFGEGSLSIAFVPVYTDCLYRQGRPEADRLAASAMRLLALAMTIGVILLMVAAPWVVRLLAPGFAQHADKFSLSVGLTRMMVPYVFFIGMMALCMGILNVLGHFAAPALAPVFLNVAMITAITVGAIFGNTQAGLARWLAAGVVAGGILQLALQVPFLVKHKVRPWRKSGLWHPGIGQVLRLMGPVLFGAAIYQINSLVITMLASLLPQGSVSYLYYADRLVQFPLGVFGIATATAVLPAMARQATAQDYDALRRTFAHAIKFVSFITLPAMAGLIVLREPIVALLFERGAFDKHTTQLTATALLYYGMGLWAFATVRVVLNAFYAMKDTRTPALTAVGSVTANLALGVVLMKPMGHGGLALALSLASTIHLGLLTLALRRKLGALGWRGITLSVLKSAGCAACMGVCVRWVAGWIMPVDAGSSMALLLVLVACILAGVLFYIGFAFISGIPELKLCLDMVFKGKKMR